MPEAPLAQIRQAAINNDRDPNAAGFVGSPFAQAAGNQIASTTAADQFRDALQQSFDIRAPQQQAAVDANLQNSLGQATEQARVQEQGNRFARAARGQLGGSQDAMTQGQIAGNLATNQAGAQQQAMMQQQQMQDQAAMQRMALEQQAFSNPFMDASTQALIRGLQGEQQGLAALQGIDASSRMDQREANALAGANIGNTLSNVGLGTQMFSNMQAAPQQAPQPTMQEAMSFGNQFLNPLGFSVPGS